MLKVAEWLRSIEFARVALIIATFSMAETLTSLLGRAIVARRKLRASKDAAFDAAVASNDLQTIGSYLFATLGQFTIAEYSGRPLVRSRVDQMLQKLRAFVGTTDQVSDRSAGLSDIAVPSSAGIPAELEDTIGQLTAGEQWNALARLRAELEALLRGLARGSGVDVGNRMSAGQLARALRSQGMISESTEGLLRSVIAVANRAIHGLEVSEAESQWAMRTAAAAIERVRSEAGAPNSR